MTTRRILYALAAMVALLVVGTTIGRIWADTSNVAGAFAGVTNIVSVVGILVLLVVLAVKRRGAAARLPVIVYVVLHGRSRPDHPVGHAIDTFVRREHAERFIERVKRDDPQLASHLRVVERELEAGG